MTRYAARRIQSAAVASLGESVTETFDGAKMKFFDLGQPV